MSITPPFAAVLFDLDGTLVDTAPDLAYALNTLLEEEGRPSLPYESIRAVASHGSTGLLHLGFAITTADPEFAALQQRFLQIYQHNITRSSRLFSGMDAVLTTLEQHAIPWGIVTNKPAFLTQPLLKQLSLHSRTSCTISGDTVAYSKPHPAPLLHACQLLNQSPARCLYIGDAQRDIEAGKRAGMQTVIALYGYLSDDDDPQSWQADASIHSAEELIPWLYAV